MKRIVLLLIIFALNSAACGIESSFQLAPSSRLPRWLNIPAPYSRKDVSVEITFYTSYEAKIILYGPAPLRKKLMEKMGTERYHPLTERQPRDVFPRYVIITVDGVEEILEHKQMDDVLYVVDDPMKTDKSKRTKTK